MQNLAIDFVEEGQVKSTTATTLPKRLSSIFAKLEDVIERLKPQALVVEKLYSHHKHPTTLAVLAQVRGVVALLAEKFSLAFYEFSPTRARKSFLGRGNVTSSQVKKMAENMLGRRMESKHTADAFSLVVAFSHHRKMERLKVYDRKN